MNRKIKFRGKGIEEYDRDKWYYGSYFKYNEINYFCLDDGSRSKEIDEKLKKNVKNKIIFEVQGDLNMENHIKLADVNPETVGQYTGLHDKNGKEIYEGDIVKITGSKEIDIGKVIYEYNGFIVDVMNMDRFYGRVHLLEKFTEVIGNIYEDSELLGGE